MKIQMTPSNRHEFDLIIEEPNCTKTVTVKVTEWSPGQKRARKITITKTITSWSGDCRFQHPVSSNN